MKYFNTLCFLLLLINLSFGQNLLNNTGFESNTNNWDLGVYNGALGSLTRTTSQSHSGVASGQINITTSGAAAWESQFVASGSNIIAVENGKTYQLRFWAKSNNARTNALVIRVAQPLPYNTIGGSTTVSTTSTWTEYVHTFTADADYSQARVTILCGDFVETYHFDDFILEEQTVVSNLLTNSGFETNTNNWNLSLYNGAVGSLTRTINESRLGLASGRVNITTAGTGLGSGQFMANSGHIVSVENGKTYQLRFWAKSNNTRANALEIRVAQPSPYSTIGGSTTVSTTSTWTEYVHTFTADADYSQARITILCGNFVETYHFDDFVLGELTSSAPVGGVYYVSTTGNDSNSGSLSAPFKTIQRAVNIMQPGEKTYVYPGIYRETVTSVRSGTSTLPITIEALSGGDVVLTATDAVSNWTVHSGSIYKATLGKQVHQLFAFNSGFYDFSTTPVKNPSEMMVEARYPNLGTTANGIFETPEDGNYTAITKSGDSFTVSSLPSGDYTGAKLYGYGSTSNRRWWAGSTTVLSNSGNLLQGSPAFTGSFLSDNNTGYVAGPLQLLDAEKEWSSDGTDLYFWPTSSQNPQNLSIEAKTRGLSIRLNHDFIIIDGIKTFAGAIWVEGNHNILTNMDVRHPANPLIKKQGHNGLTVPEANPLMGLRIRGNNNLFSNSKLMYTGGEGILLFGDSNTLESNEIGYTSYYGHFMHSISVSGDDSIIIGNKISDTGKEHVRIYPSARRVKVLYNNILRNGYVAHDLGNIVAWGVHTEGSEIAYNWIHDNESSSISGGNHGIYLDNNNKDILIHHNVIWNIRGNNIRFNSPQYNMYVYNNTLGNSDQNIGDGVYFNPGLGLTDEMVNCNFKNNYMHRAITFASKYTVIKSNNEINTNVNVFSHPSFYINSSSPAVDKGIALNSVVFTGGATTVTFPSVTEFVTDGTPDAGAYEAGGVQWIPGINRIENNGGVSSKSSNTKALENELLEEEVSEEINLFPNPATDVVNIQLSNNKLIHSIEVFDFNGRSVFNKSKIKNVNEFQLDVSTLNSGTYIVKIHSNIDGTSINRLIIKK